MEIEVTRDALDAVLAEAMAACPQEACGILLGEGMSISEVRPAPNVHPEPGMHFEIDPQALIDAHRAARQGGPQVIGYYHSHPGGPAEPSATDRKQAAHDGRIWGIVGAGEVTFWRDGPEGFVPLSYIVAER